MTHEEQRIYLIQELLAEESGYKNIPFLRMSRNKKIYCAA